MSDLELAKGQRIYRHEVPVDDQFPNGLVWHLMERP